MAERDWLAASDPVAMLYHVRYRATDRKLRLFACACCRRVWHLLEDPRSRQAVEAAERCAEGLVPAAERAVLREVEWAAQWAVAERASAFLAVRKAAGAARSAAAGAAAGTRMFAEEVEQVLRDTITAEGPARREAARADRAALLLDLFGNPFRPAAVDPAWLSWGAGTVLRLAHAAYDEQRFEVLPILADALEDAGCDDTPLLNHCRAGGVHLLGCWALDLLLNKG